MGNIHKICEQNKSETNDKLREADWPVQENTQNEDLSVKAVHFLFNILVINVLKTRS